MSLTHTGPWSTARMDGSSTATSKGAPMARTASAAAHPFADTLQSFRTASGKSLKFHSLPALAQRHPSVSRLPVSVRMVLEDFTGVPLLADLAAMRNVAEGLGKNPKRIEPLVPVDLVVDHSVMIDHYGTNK